MTRNPSSAKTLRLALSGAVAAALLTGCAGGGKFAEASQRAVKSEAKAQRLVEQAEKAVERSPRDAALRLSLGQAYLDAGRFDSAASAFNDALALGDTSGSTALRLALSEVGAGNRAEAVAVLDEYRETIPASDLGLALALAGDTTRGVTVLSDALRGGDDTVKTRQNLAYAYALDGRWREARLMAAQDVPADQLDARISDWAMQGRPEDSRQRVASLLKVEIQPDAGQPARLALSQPDEPLAAAPALAASLPAAVELPAIAEAPRAPAPEPIAPPAAQTFAVAFTAAPAALEPAAAPLPMRPLPERPASAARTAKATTPSGNHVVQLGSFSSEGNARRAIAIYSRRNPQLRDMQLAIIPATVRGKNFWRVAATGFSAGAARRACANVRISGGACFAYAAPSAPTGTRSAPVFASARR